MTATIGDAEVVTSCCAVDRFGTCQEEPIVLNWRLGHCKKRQQKTVVLISVQSPNRSSEKRAKLDKDVVGHGHERRCFDSGSAA